MKKGKRCSGPSGKSNWSKSKGRASGTSNRLMLKFKGCKPPTRAQFQSAAAEGTEDRRGVRRLFVVGFVASNDMRTVVVEHVSAHNPLSEEIRLSCWS